MGNYLTSPNVVKSIESGRTDRFSYSTCAMQGWRVSMEDAHVAHILNRSTYNKKLPKTPSLPIAFFGVYDGHGGSHVAQFVARHIRQEFFKTLEFQSGQFDTAFKNAYIAMDQLIMLPQSQMELQILSENTHRHQKTTPEKSWKSNGASLKSKGYRQVSNAKTENSKALDYEGSCKIRGCRTRVRFNSKHYTSQAGLNDFESDVDSSVTFETSCISDEYPNQTKQPIQPTSKTTSESLYEKIAFFRDQANSTESGRTSKFFPKRHEITSNFLKKASGKCHYKQEYRWAKAFEKKKLETSEKNRLPSNSTSSLPGLSNFFSMQTVKSFISAVSQAGSSVGRHGSISHNKLASFTGCTALSVLMTSTQIVVANAGDSRCVLCRGDRAVELSKDHKPFLPEEQARIYAAGGWLEMGRINGNLNLSRAVGDLVYKSNTSLSPDKQVVSVVPDVVIVDITDQDSFLILGCDGIWESSTSQDIVNFISGRINAVEKLSDVLEVLFEELLSPNPTFLECGCDNMTAILIDLKPKCRRYSTHRKKNNSAHIVNFNDVA